MQIFGFKREDYAADRIIRRSDSKNIVLEKVPAYVVFQANAVYLDFVGDRKVPQLHMDARVLRVVPAVPEMPFSINQIDFNPDELPEISLDYSFDIDQLQLLVARGLYLPGFEPPVDMLTSNEMEIPMEIDMVISAPAKVGEPPIVAVDVVDFDRVEMDFANSHYRLAEFFPDEYTASKEAGTMVEGKGVSAEMVRAEDYENLFGDQAAEAGTLPEEALGFDVYDTAQVLPGQLRSDKMLADLAARHGDLTPAEVLDQERKRNLTPWEDQMREFYNDNVATKTDEEELVASISDVDDEEWEGMDNIDFGDIDLGDSTGMVDHHRADAEQVADEEPEVEADDDVEFDAEADQASPVEAPEVVEEFDDLFASDEPESDLSEGSGKRKGDAVRRIQRERTERARRQSTASQIDAAAGSMRPKDGADYDRGME